MNGTDVKCQTRRLDWLIFYFLKNSSWSFTQQTSIRQTPIIISTYWHSKTQVSNFPSNREVSSSPLETFHMIILFVMVLIWYTVRLVFLVTTHHFRSQSTCFISSPLAPIQYYSLLHLSAPLEPPIDVFHRGVFSWYNPTPSTSGFYHIIPHFPYQPPNFCLYYVLHP